MMPTHCTKDNNDNNNNRRKKCAVSTTIRRQSADSGKPELNGNISMSDECRTRDQAKTSSRDTSCRRHLFPKQLPWIIVCLTLVYRINYVLSPDNWWILHPDEVFQTVEVAHTEAYGYGFRSYEYLQPPPRQFDSNKTVISAARALEVSRDMYSLRSFILPKLISYVLLAAEQTNLDMSPFLIGKLLHATITSFLPLAVYWFVINLYRSRDVAVLSAILVSCSPSLNVFGTHTLINSFVSPFHFYALAVFVNIVQRVERNQSHRPCQQGDDNTIVHDPDDKQVASNGKLTNMKSTLCNDVKLNLKPKHCRKARQAPKLLSVVNVKKLLKSFSVNELVSGTILGLSIYVRCDLVLLPALITCVCRDTFIEMPYKLLRELRTFLVGFATAILIGGYVDSETFGHWFISPVQWFKFNVLNNSAAAIFGSSPSLLYLQTLFHNEPMLIMLFILLLLDIGIEVFKTLSGHQKKHGVAILMSKNPFLFIFAILFTLFSASSHKEFRFLHNTLVFMYIALACAIVRLCEIETQYISNQKKHGRSSFIYVLYVSLCVVVSSHVYYFQRIHGSTVADWSYGKDVLSGDVNKGLEYLRHQNDVSGVFIDMPVQMSGGYSLLHHDVPILAINKYEYLEYDKTLKVRNVPKSFLARGISSFGLISDFISVHNTHYLLKHLIKKRQYNYLVLHAQRDFFDKGFHMVYNTTNVKIWRRYSTNESETILTDMANRIPFGTNATILEYEGDWLNHFGCYLKAEERLVFANHLNNTLIGPFQILVSMYKHLNSMDNFDQVHDACLQVHTHQACNSKYTPLKLHPEYFRGG